MNNIFFDFFNVAVKAQKVREDDSKREVFVRFGVTGIIFSMIALALSAVAGFLFPFTAEGTASAIIVMVIIAVLILCALAMLIGALLRVIAQLSINKKPLSWVALAVFIACVAASVAVIAVLSVR